MPGCRPLTEDEIEKVTNSFKGKHVIRDKALFIVGIKTGFRISELLSLQIKQVYEYGQVVDRIRIEREFLKDKLESQSVPLHTAAKDAIAALIASYGKPDPEQYLFRSQKGGNRHISRNYAYTLFKDACKMAEMSGKLGPHSWRKTFAEKVYRKSGKNLLKTQKALRHRDPRSTIAYLGWKIDEIDELILED